MHQFQQYRRRRVVLTFLPESKITGLTDCPQIFGGEWYCFVCDVITLWVKLDDSDERQRYTGGH